MTHNTQTNHKGEPMSIKEPSLLFQDDYIQPGGDTFTFPAKYIPLDLIDLNPAGYQRELDEARATREFASKWDPRLYNPIKVARTGTGRYHVWDGQHRLHALRLLKAPGAWCLVINGTTEEQAKLFRREQESRRDLNTFDDYHAALVARDDVVLEIDRVLASAGFYIPRRKSSAAKNGLFPINAVSAVTRTGRNPAHLHSVLSVLVSAWGYESDAVSLPLLLGMSVFLRKYPDIDTDVLAKKLGSTISPRRLILDSRAAKTEFGYSSASAVAKIILGIYNRGRRSGYLENRIDA